MNDFEQSVPIIENLGMQLPEQFKESPFLKMLKSFSQNVEILVFFM